MWFKVMERSSEIPDQCISLAAVCARASNEMGGTNLEGGLIGRMCDRSGQESLGRKSDICAGFSCPAVFF